MIMIELKEKDFLWKCYERYYKYDDGRQPAPGSICNLFWKAVGGMWFWLFWDSMSLITGPIILAILAGSIWLFDDINGWKHFFLGLPLAIFIFFMGLYCFFFFVTRYIEYLKTKGKTGEVISCISVIIAIAFVISFVAAKTIQGEKQPWSWWFLLYGFYVTLCVFALFAMVLGGAALFASNTGRVIQACFVSFKDRVCPLVKSPWDVQENIDVEQRQEEAQEPLR